jgi:predicted nucleic acid-binding protein
MQVIVDTNVIFSAIISGKSIYKKLITTYEVFSLDYLFSELATYQTVILEKTKLDKSQIAPYLLAIFSGIKVVPSMLLSESSRQQAYDLCFDIDLKDAPYIALSIELGIILITNDKVLFEGLQKKKFKNITLFEDFVNQYL